MCTSQECIRVIKDNLPTIQKEFGVTGLYLFGSVARGDNRENSDVDILVDMPPKIFMMVALKDFLEKILNSSVDLLRRHSHFSPQFQEQLLQDAITIL